VDRADERDVGASAAAHAGQVEDDRLVQAGALQARDGVERGEAGERGVGGEDAAVAQVDAEDQRAGRQLREHAVERLGAAERLGPDDDAVRAELQQRARRGRLGHARVDHEARLGGERAEQGGVAAVRDAVAPRGALAAPDDRVEVRDVDLFEPQLGAEPSREGQRVAVLAADGAADRAIAFALAAHGVDRRAVLQIDDTDDAHASHGGGHASSGHRRREHEGGVAA
jgi:hypothetical protein